MKESRCIICGEKKDGLEVQNDFYIDALRWIKRNVTKNEKGYRLVVCKEDYVKYRKSRDSYQRRQWVYVILGIIFTVAISLAAGPRLLGAIFSGIVITILLYLFSLFNYVPAVNMPAVKKRV